MDFDREKLNSELLKDFDDAPEKSDKKPQIDLESEPGIPIKILLPLAIIIGIVGGVYSWKAGIWPIDASGSGEPTLIKADKEPVRIKPDDPGGMYIANRDKLIYETISDKEDNSLPKVVKILPRHEEPVEREDIVKKSEELFATLPTKIVEQKSELSEDSIKKEQEVVTANNEASGVETNEIIKKQELLSSDIAVLETPKEDVDDKVNEKPEQKKEEPITVSDIQNVPTPTIRSRGVIEPKKSNNGIKIQLGSFRTETDVQKNWSTIKKKHSSLLKGMNLDTQKADLGDKGIFYRLRVGSLENESDARKLCKKLIEQKQGCFVVKK